MNQNKIKLETKRKHIFNHENHASYAIRYALPYFLSQRGIYFHILRSADNHWRDGDVSHTSVKFWCGAIGFLGLKGRLYKEVPEYGVLCATCQGRVVGSGLDGERAINGKPVMYSPREIKDEK